MTSPIQNTPADDISAFTPSSTSRNIPALNPASSKISIIDPPSSPTIQRRAGPTELDKKHGIPASIKFRQREAYINADEEEKDETLPAFDIAEESLLITKKHQAEQLRRKLEEQKARAIKALALSRTLAEKKVANPKKAVERDEEDDLDIMAESPVKAKPIPSKSDKGRRGPDAKAILQYNSSSSTPAFSRNKLKLLSHAGLPARLSSKPATTETYAAFAGTTFNHSNLQNDNSGAKPAGMKAGRDIPITQKEMEEFIRKGHAEQALKERMRKEGIFGKGRKMPERNGWDFEGLISQVEEDEKRREERGLEFEEGEEEDEDDDDFVPDGEEGEGVDEVIYSGKEDVHEENVEIHDDDAGKVAGNDDDGDEGKNQVDLISTEGEEDEETDTPIRRKPRASARVVDSDDEGEPAAENQEAPQEAKIPAVPLLRKSTPEQPIELDLAGFGSGGGSPGFSQLFEATQLGTGAAVITQKVKKTPLCVVKAN